MIEHVEEAVTHALQAAREGIAHVLEVGHADPATTVAGSIATDTAGDEDGTTARVATPAVSTVAAVPSVPGRGRGIDLGEFADPALLDAERHGVGQILAEDLSGGFKVLMTIDLDEVAPEGGPAHSCVCPLLGLAWHGAGCNEGREASDADADEQHDEERRERADGAPEHDAAEDGRADDADGDEAPGVAHGLGIAGEVATLDQLLVDCGLDLALFLAEALPDIAHLDLVLAAEERTQELSLRIGQGAGRIHPGDSPVAPIGEQATEDFLLGLFNMDDAALGEADHNGNQIVGIDFLVDQRADCAGWQVVGRLPQDVDGENDLEVLALALPVEKEADGRAEDDEQAGAEEEDVGEGLEWLELFFALLAGFLSRLPGWFDGLGDVGIFDAGFECGTLADVAGVEGDGVVVDLFAGDTIDALGVGLPEQRFKGDRLG